MGSTVRSEAARLAGQLERSYRGGAWHGPSLAEALDGVDFERAVRRPLDAAHTIAEITAHVTFWIEVARQRIIGEAREGPPPEADWPGTGPESAAGWRALLDDLERAHRRLHDTVGELEDRRLEDPVPGSDPTVRGLILGVVQHNAYHAGQIVLLAKNARGGARPR